MHAIRKPHYPGKGSARWALIVALPALATACEFSPSAPSPAESAEVAASLQVLQGVAVLPDLQTVVPDRLQLVRKQKREVLRFTNGIANTGEGPLELRPVLPVDDPTQTQDAVQYLYDAAGNVVDALTVSSFEFHADHNHWHIDDVALYEVRRGSPDGEVYGQSVKVTFCLIDWIKLEGNSPSRERVYWDCNGDAQGISPGWVDQYHHALPDQDIDITGAPTGLYYLISTANPEGRFVEADDTNNTAWVAFELTRPAKGNLRIRVVGHSPCAGGLCGSRANR